MLRVSTMATRRVQQLLAAALVLVGAALRLRVNWHWAYAGSDSYGYLKLADEWWSHGRYALGPAPEPLHFGRVPLYPLFLALVKRSNEAKMSGGPGWMMITHAQIALEVAALPLVYLLARRLANAWAALAALALAALWPPSVVYASAALTESLATTLSTATLAALVLGAQRPRLWFAIAGVLAALSLLLRPDGIILLAPLAMATTRLPVSRRERLHIGALALGAFTLVYAPWPVRNLIQFHQARFFGAHVDRLTHTVPDAQSFWRWVRGWCSYHEPVVPIETCFYEASCPAHVGQLPAEAIEDQTERDAVTRLFELRRQGGISRAVLDGFDELGRRRERRHPLDVYLLLPLSRIAHLWVTDNIEPFAHPSLWRAMARLKPWMRPLTLALVLATLAGALGLAYHPETRTAAWVLVGWLGVRTVVLGWSFHTLPRYAMEMYPTAIVVACAGLALWLPRRKSSQP
jgi:4-amino-4-deoxy-L-arabinose transferase-like glycosyltransferase